jgi:hypothetical protein
MTRIRLSLTYEELSALDDALEFVAMGRYEEDNDEVFQRVRSKVGETYDRERAKTYDPMKIIRAMQG